MEKITSLEIKRTNRNNVFTAIYQARQISKQQLAENLNLSLPTITQNLRELEALGLIKKEGFFDSTSASSRGRRARIIRCNATSRISVGVEVLKEKSHIVAVDLYGTLIQEDTLQIPFQNTELYHCALGNWINSFVAELSLPAAAILGVGISMQGLVSADHTQILYGELIGATGLRLKDFAKYVKWPCFFLHDSEAAAFAETWLNQSLSDALFVWLNPNFGSALIIDGKLHQSTGPLTGTLEHMRLIPGGKLCYCGQEGCTETYCSADALKQDANEELEFFFPALRQGDPKRQEIWDRYLKHLALTLNNVLMVIDCDVIFSGLLSQWLLPKDLDQLTAYLKELSAFSFYQPSLHMGASNQHAASIGAALYQISAFLDHGDVFQ